LGKWSGTWEAAAGGGELKGQDVLMVITKVDYDHKIVELNYRWAAVRQFEAGEANFRAKYIPPDKFEWYTQGQWLFQFQLKGGILWGTRTRGQHQAKITMEKIME